MLDLKKAAKRIDELSRELRRHNQLYYKENRPEISDTEYDKLLDELAGLEERFPHLKAADSPTQTVGAPIKTSFNPVKHFRPMLSLESKVDRVVVEDFLRRLLEYGAENAKLIVQPKIDGLSVELNYRDGLLQQGSTRGDGFIGEDITPNLRTIADIPSCLKNTNFEQLIVRGEVFMSRDGFFELNRKLIEQGVEPFANPRNAAAGSLRQTDPSITAQRPLKFFPFEISNASNMDLSTDLESFDLIESLGFSIYRKYQHSGTNLEFLEKLHTDYEALREELPFEIDGIVIKLDDLSLREAMGSRSRTPRWAVAWKFPPRQERTTVRKIVAQVGRTGKITPVALLDPVDVGGVTVSRATLHNYNEVLRLGVRVGDTVRVERAGDVIPRVAEVLPCPVFPPSECPSCGTKLTRVLKTDEVTKQKTINILGVMVRARVDGKLPNKVNAISAKPGVKDQDGEAPVRFFLESEGADHICPNHFGCPAQALASITHFASRGAMDIEGLGPSRVEELMSLGFISDVPSVYDLQDKQDELARLKGWGEQSAGNLINAINGTRGRPFDRFIFALGIPGVGEATARLLAQTYTGLKDLMAASRKDLEKLETVGPEVASKIIEFFAEPKNKNAALKLYGAIKPGAAPKAAASTLFAGLTVVFTGEMESMARPEAEELVRSLGGKTSGSVSKSTGLVVAGPGAGSKLEKARQLGVEVIDEKEFLKRIANEGPGPQGKLF